MRLFSPPLVEAALRRHLGVPFTPNFSNPNVVIPNAVRNLLSFVSACAIHSQSSVFPGPA
jgi:hypothetical protein